MRKYFVWSLVLALLIAIPSLALAEAQMRIKSTSVVATNLIAPVLGGLDFFEVRVTVENIGDAPGLAVVTLDPDLAAGPGFVDGVFKAYAFIRNGATKTLTGLGAIKHTSADSEAAYHFTVKTARPNGTIADTKDVSLSERSLHLRFSTPPLSPVTR